MTGTQAELNEAEPNVFVAHLKDGIEVVRLQTGRTICKLHLASPGLHVDLNGDGVLDHLQATGMIHGGSSHKVSALQHYQMDHYIAYAASIMSWTTYKPQV